MSLFPKSQHFVVVGAGYAGLPCTLRLARNFRHESGKVQITLVSQDSRQELTCDLYRTLRTGKAEQYSFVPTLRRTGVNFIEGTVTKIQPSEKSLLIRGSSPRTLKYDHLILATGCRPRLPDLDGLEDLVSAPANGEKRVFPFHNNVQVQSLRLALKRLGWSPDVKPTRDLFVVVLGAGLTGLEVAGELAALRGKNNRCRIVLVDERTDLLPTFSPIAKRLLNRELRRLSVETVLGSPATRVNSSELSIKNGQIIPWDLMVLCSGTRPPIQILDAFEDSATAQGLRVKPNLQIEGFPDHFAVGDIAAIPRDPSHASDHRFLPHLAQYAIQEGHFVAELLTRKIKDGSYPTGLAFHAHDLGSLISLGPRNGLGRVGPELSSAPARFFSPFVAGPFVEQLKRVARLRYLAQVKIDSLYPSLLP